MQLDSTFAKEIKKASGNGSRDAKFNLLDKIDAARKDLSTTNVKRTFNECIRKHGRAVIGICVAQTLIVRKERLDNWNLLWAYEVIQQLPQCITTRNLDRAIIDDGIHPTAICDYANELIKVTTI